MKNHCCKRIFSFSGSFSTYLALSFIVFAYCSSARTAPRLKAEEAAVLPRDTAAMRELAMGIQRWLEGGGWGGKTHDHDCLVFLVGIGEAMKTKQAGTMVGGVLSVLVMVDKEAKNKKGWNHFIH